MTIEMPAEGWRILGFGADEKIAAGIQDQLRRAGLRSTNFAVRDDPESDARLRAALAADVYDAVTIGAVINGQHPSQFPATEQTTAWLNRTVTTTELPHSPVNDPVRLRL